MPGGAGLSHLYGPRAEYGAADLLFLRRGDKGPGSSGRPPDGFSFSDEPRPLRFPGQPGLQVLAELGWFQIGSRESEQTRDAPPKGRSGRG